MEVDTNITKNNLPGDWWNAAFIIEILLKNYRSDSLSEGEFRERLRHAETFDDYYRRKIRESNKHMLKFRKQDESYEPYDEDASISAQREIIPNKEYISLFDEKMMELRKMADDEIIDDEKIIKIVRKDIQEIVYGKK